MASIGRSVDPQIGTDFRFLGDADIGGVWISDRGSRQLRLYSSDSKCPRVNVFQTRLWRRSERILAWLGAPRPVAAAAGPYHAAMAGRAPEPRHSRRISALWVTVPWREPCSECASSQGRNSDTTTVKPTGSA